jgi:phosphopantetheine--protein transferase-like protein
MDTLDKFIINLTGKEGLKLSDLKSGQKARAIAWARDAGIELDGELSSNLSIKSKEMPLKFVDNISPNSIMIGIDIQSVSEFFPHQIHDIKSDKSLLKIFTLKEMSYAESKKEPLKHLTGIFSLKEAVMKASGKMTNDITEVEILHSIDGAPLFDSFSLNAAYSGDLVIGIAISISTNDNKQAALNEINERISSLEKNFIIQNVALNTIPLYVVWILLIFGFGLGYFIYYYKIFELIFG